MLTDAETSPFGNIIKYCGRDKKLFIIKIIGKFCESKLEFRTFKWGNDFIFFPENCIPEMLQGMPDCMIDNMLSICKKLSKISIVELFLSDNKDILNIVQSTIKNQLCGMYDAVINSILSTENTSIETSTKSLNNNFDKTVINMGNDNDIGFSWPVLAIPIIGVCIAVAVGISILCLEYINSYNKSGYSHTSTDSSGDTMDSNVTGVTPEGDNV